MSSTWKFYAHANYNIILPSFFWVKNNNNKGTIISFIYRKNTYDLICLAEETYKCNDLWSYLINQICLPYSHIDSSWHKCSINVIKTITLALFFVFFFLFFVFVFSWLNRHWTSIRGKIDFETPYYGMNLMRNRTHK